MAYSSVHGGDDLPLRSPGAGAPDTAEPYGNPRGLAAAQQPSWGDHPGLPEIRERLAELPALVTPSEVSTLRELLARVESGAAYLLHVGECAETFAMADGAHVDARSALYRKLAGRLSERTGRPVVLVARMAGQHAKPRSRPLECLADGTVLPVYRGDAVNGLEATAVARAPEPCRLLTSHARSQETLARLAPQRHDGHPVFVSHEALLRDYEEPMTREADHRYAGSGHLVWIGERTRKLTDWHVQWASRLHNPVGVKLGPGTTDRDVVDLVRALNPRHETGRLSLIARTGAAAAAAGGLDPLVSAVAGSGSPVLWQCDPMHGNTRTHNGQKLRLLPDLRAEISSFVTSVRRHGGHPGGLHLEVTPEAVRECHESLPGRAPDSGTDAPPCDPRLNPAQAMEIVEHFADAVGV
ncbi:3-deoxy-D-arabinoheptulosonate-7-phosphate synthase [Streptomyces sp. Amel2xB2]|uniref:3-deoxy-7-phosphoheptulonate synthase n=1 Tax=Streptomyces sp. Amel2xB2 TaxID=1305829 RepID=UPI000DBFBB2B|nr:3-deoxy-7-phosphoheptulonate synthase [Streptomyces sp. Amel2xB2]RAJ60493.1 3-deoxy-D-arabinoheptulosonate-7-phosphate synthase [Streptomyces sp. Amel2xB2]